MERFNALGRGGQLMLVGAVLLFIDLFLPWQDFDVGGIAEEFGVDATFSGWRGIGAILGILTILLLVWIGVRLAAVKIPLPISTAMTSALLGALVLAFGIIKILTILGDETTIWSWIGLVLAVVIAVGAWLEVQAAGGMDALKTEIPSVATAGAGPAASAPEPSSTAAPPPPPPPAAAEPPPPPPEPRSMPDEPSSAPEEPERERET